MEHYFEVLTDRRIETKRFNRILVENPLPQRPELRVSWFKDEQLQGEIYLNLKEDKFDHPELCGNRDWFPGGGSQNGLIEVYFSQDNKLVSFDYLTPAESSFGVTRTYVIEELFNNCC